MIGVMGHINILTIVMDIKFCSFNCKGFNISNVKHIEEVLIDCDILLLQETWFLKSQVGTINQYFPDFNTYGISGVNETIVLQGRRYGGCSFLFRKSLSPRVIYIDVNSSRVCCIQIKTNLGYLYVFNVYLPCDTTNNVNLQEYNEVLSVISKCLETYKAEFCLIIGDLNTDLSRVNSGNTISLKSFVEKENLHFVVQEFSNNVQFTFTGINDNHSLIDHCIISQNLIKNVTQYFTEDSIDNLSDHIPLYCSVCCRVDYDISSNSNLLSNFKAQWSYASKEQILAYQLDLDERLQLFSLSDNILHCNHSSVCTHDLDITRFHDNIIHALSEAMNLHISQKYINRKQHNVIPGWDNEMNCAREESLFWHHIWIECSKPISGIVYDIMCRCRSVYHYKLRALKKKKQNKIRIAISKKALQDTNQRYWKSVKLLRKNNYNTTSTVDGHVGCKNIANHFQSKFKLLFNSVTSSSESLENVYNCISKKVEKYCCSHSANNEEHCHVIRKYDVNTAIAKLKTDKIDEGGILLSNNFICGTDTLHCYLSALYTSMISHGYAPKTFLQSSMLPIPKGARANLSDSDMYRSIAISSLLSKILDHVIIARQYSLLSTSNYQFGFKAKSSTVLCSTMVIETIQYYIERGSQSVYLLLLDASKAFDKVSYEIVFNLYNLITNFQGVNYPLPSILFPLRYLIIVYHQD